MIYQQKPGDAVWTMPQSGWAFSRSADPSGARLPTAALLRSGLVYLMRREGARFVLPVEPQGRAGGPPLTPGGPWRNGRGTGTDEPTFLSEQRERWRNWAVAHGIDPDALSARLMPWADFASIADAAATWQWERII